MVVVLSARACVRVCVCVRACVLACVCVCVCVCDYRRKQSHVLDIVLTESVKKYIKNGIRSHADRHVSMLAQHKKGTV